MSLEYNFAFHLRCQITLQSGRSITLRSLQQRLTYAGWLEGVPTKRWNDQIIEGSRQQAMRECIEGASPILIPPARRDYLREPGDMEWRRALVQQRGLGQDPEWLPEVACIGVLQGSAPARDPNKHGSVLTVVWFQDEYALPIDESVFLQIQGIDWEKVATDFEF